MLNISFFAERLSELMFDNKITKEEILNDFRINRTTLNRYLAGKRVPSLTIMIKFADLFNCSMDYLLGGTDYSDIKKFKSCPPFNEQLTILLNEFATNKSQFQIKTGISESLIYDWQYGRHIPSVDNIIKIAESYKCSVDFVVGRGD